MRVRFLALLALAACSAAPKRVAISPTFAPQVQPLASAWSATKRDPPEAWIWRAQGLSWASAMHVVAAERAGDAARAEQVIAEHEALIDDIVASARAAGQAHVVERVLVLGRDQQRHVSDLAWASAQEEIPAVLAAARAGDTGALKSAIDAAAKADGCDTWARSLQALARATPADETTLRLLALVPRSDGEPEPRALAIALRANEHGQGRGALPLIAAQALLDTSDPVDAAVLLDGLPEVDQQQPLVKALRAKAALALGDAAAYLAWRPIECVASPSVIAYEARFRQPQLPDVDAIARDAMMRSLGTSARFASSVIGSPGFTADERRRAVERLRLAEPGRAAWAELCLQQDVDACRTMRDVQMRPTLKGLAGASNLDGVPPSALTIALDGDVIGTPDQRALMGRLDTSAHARDPGVALMHVFTLMRERKLDEAMALLTDPATVIDDEDILACVLGIADVREGRLDARYATSAGVRSFMDYDEPDGAMELSSLHRSSIEMHRSDALLDRLWRADMMTGTAQGRQAGELYETLLAVALPPRGRAELVARVVSAYILADDVAAARRIAAAYPEIRGSFQDLVVRGYLAAESAPGEAVALLGEAAADARMSRRAHDVFGYALVRSGADTEGFSRSAVIMGLHPREAVPEDLETALAAAVWPWRTLAESPGALLARGYARHRFEDQLMHAATNADVEAAARAYVVRADPSDAVERAWFSVMAGDNGAVFEAMRLPAESPKRLDDASEVFLLGAERTHSRATLFDALLVRELWKTREAATADMSLVERLKVTPQTPEGNELVCRVLMRFMAPQPAAPYCIAAFRAGRHDQRLRDHMAWIAAHSDRLPRELRVSADDVFAQPSTSTSYAFAYLRAWDWYRRGQSKQAAESFRDGIAALDGRDFQWDPMMRAVVVAYDGPLVRGLYPNKPADPRFHSLAIYAVESCDVAAARVANNASKLWSKDGVAALVDDYIELLDDDLRAKRVACEDAAKAVVSLYERRKLQADSPDSHLVKLARAQEAFVERDNAKASSFIDEVAKAHPQNVTVARLQVRILVAEGRRETARARLSALALPDGDQRRADIEKIIDAGKNQPISETL